MAQLALSRSKYTGRDAIDETAMKKHFCFPIAKLEEANIYMN